MCPLQSTRLHAILNDDKTYLQFLDEHLPVCFMYCDKLFYRSIAAQIGVSPQPVFLSVYHLSRFYVILAPVFLFSTNSLPEQGRGGRGIVAVSANLEM